MNLRPRRLKESVGKSPPWFSA